MQNILVRDSFCRLQGGAWIRKKRPGLVTNPGDFESESLSEYFFNQLKNSNV